MTCTTMTVVFADAAVDDDAQDAFATLPRAASAGRVSDSGGVVFDRLPSRSLRWPWTRVHRLTSITSDSSNRHCQPHTARGSFDVHVRPHAVPVAHETRRCRSPLDRCEHHSRCCGAGCSAGASKKLRKKKRFSGNGGGEKGRKVGKGLGPSCRRTIVDENLIFTDV